MIAQKDSVLTDIKAPGVARVQAGGMKQFDFEDRPFIVIWEITRACALACRHCRASAQTLRHPLELNSDEALDFVDQVARTRPALFVLTGGDPMQREDLHAILARAQQNGLRVALSPSATPLFVSTDMARLKELGVARVSLSIDGATRDSHDRFRGVPGTWDLTMEAVRRVAEAGIELQINTTFTRQNLGEFDSFVELVTSLNPVLWSVFQLVPTGRGKAGDMLAADEMEYLFERLQELSCHARFDIKTTEGHHYRRVVLQKTRDRGSLQKRAPIGINDGKGFVFVSHIGEIFPSGFLPVSGGNVRREELIDVYRNHPLFRQLRDPRMLRGKCGICEFNKICGGSRARAYAMSGDPFGEEPLCSYHPVPRTTQQTQPAIL